MIHLHRHSEFSRLDGVGTAQQYAERAAELGQPAIGLTDHGTLSGLLHHIQACKESKITPISGVEAYYRPDRSLRDKEQRNAWHLCFWAKNLRGWHSLLRLTSIAYQENTEGGGFYQYPCVDIPLMEQHSEGVICSTACISGWLSSCILKGDDKGAKKWIQELKRIYKDDVYLEIMPHDFEDQRTTNIEIINLAYETSTPLITGVDAHVPYKSWAKTQQVAKLLSTNSSFQKEEKRKEKIREKKGDEAAVEENFAKLLPTVYLMSEEEVKDLYHDAHPDIDSTIVQESIDNTHLILRSTTPFMLSKREKLPRVSKSWEESEKILRDWVEEGLKRVGHQDREDARERLEFEFDTLREKKVIDYFLLVGDFVRWCKSEKIRVTCRGSAAGCYISYLIGISPLDPLPTGHNLLFERFLNPGRKGLPDIDIDIQSDRRPEAKEYLANKYGHDHVADIIAHQTFQPNKVLVDVARAFDLPFTEIQELSKTIDIKAEDDETTLEEIRPLNPDLDKFANEHPEIYEHALRLEGLVATASKHAAGVVITDKPVADYMPLERGKKGDLVTSWSDRADFPAVSDNGFLKIDALGVKGLAKQDFAVQLIKERHGVDVDLEDLDVVRDPNAVDQEVMEIFRRGLTLGIWQFGGRGITQFMKQVEPQNINDLTACNALYRPGGMASGVTWEYADLMKMPDEEIVYWDEAVRPVLEETRGVIAFQEQVMEICKRLGGFSPSQADDMRKAMGKLYRLPGSEAKRFMEGFKSTWDNGIKKAGIDLAVAEDIWQKILAFGGYGFNKSHSACYAVQAYQDAYLKRWYPAEFYMGLLHFPPSSTKKKAEDKAKFVQAVFREAEAIGVSVAPPDINKSDRSYTIDGDTIRFGLCDIKEVGDTAYKEIVKHRPFWNWKDFEKRTEKKKCNAKVKKGLIKSGACDRWGKRDDVPGSEIGALEREYLGIALTMAGDTHRYSGLIEENIYSVEEFEELNDDAEVIVGGDVIDVSIVKTKKGKNPGQEMAFVTLAFGTEQWRVTFFPEMWQRHKALIESGSMIVNGRKNTYRKEESIVANACVSIAEWAENVEKEEELLNVTS